MPWEQADKGLADSTTIKTPLNSVIRCALGLIINYSLDTVKFDGHWCGGLRSNATITREYVFLR